MMQHLKASFCLALQVLKHGSPGHFILRKIIPICVRIYYTCSILQFSNCDQTTLQGITAEVKATRLTACHMHTSLVFLDRLHLGKDFELARIQAVFSDSDEFFRTHLATVSQSTGR